MRFKGCSRGGFLVVFVVLDRAMMELTMIIEILEWGGRGMRFVKSEEILSGLWLF